MPRARCDITVSGRACTMKSSPLRPSFAHSMSIGIDRPKRLRIVLLDRARPAGEREDLVIGEREAGALFGCDRDVANGPLAAGVVDELELLAAEALAAGSDESPPSASA